MERAKLVCRPLFSSDIVTTIASFVLAYRACHLFFPDEKERLSPFPKYFQWIPIMGLVWAFFLHLFRICKSYRTRSLLGDSWDSLRITFCDGLVLLLFIFGFMFHSLSRGLIGTLLSMIILSPILLASAIAMKADPSGPIVFSQKRLGLNGRAFAFYQFRFMVKGAKTIRNRPENLNAMSGPVFKTKDDPWLTRLGRFAWRHSIDGLQQLCDMSTSGVLNWV